MYKIPIAIATNLLKITPSDKELTAHDMYKGIYVGNGCLFASDGAVAILHFDDNAPSGWVFVPKEEVLLASANHTDIKLSNKFKPGIIKFERVIDICKRTTYEPCDIHCLQLGLLSKLQSYADGLVGEGEQNFGAIKKINEITYAVEWEKSPDTLGIIRTHTGKDLFKFDPLLDRAANLINKTDFI